jgi:hypothetical protein
MYILYIFVLLSKLRNMKKILLAAASSILLMASCTQQNTPSPINIGNTNQAEYTLYPTYFISITFLGKTLTANGIWQKNDQVNKLLSDFSPNGRIYTMNANTNKTFSMSLMSFNGIIKHTGFQLSSLTVAKLDTVSTGIYGFYNGGRQNPYGVHVISGTTNFKDTSLWTSGVEYEIDTSIKVNITNIGLHNISGSFTCKFVNGATLIPASGSFNVYKQ